MPRRSDGLVLHLQKHDLEISNKLLLVPIEYRQLLRKKLLIYTLLSVDHSSCQFPLCKTIKLNIDETRKFCKKTVSNMEFINGKLFGRKGMVKVCFIRRDELATLFLARTDERRWTSFKCCYR